MKLQEIIIEVSNRLDTLTEEYNLTRNIFYSYQYDRTVLVSTDFDLDLKRIKGLVDIDTARVQGVKIRKFVESFEFKHRNCKVYHVIHGDKCLYMLYVSSDKSNWVSERLQNGMIKAYVYDKEKMKEIGFKKIVLGSKENVLDIV